MLIVALVAATGWFGTGDPETVIVSATPSGGVFEAWPKDKASILDEEELQETNCTFWDTSVQFSSPLCSHFSLARLAGSHAGRATERAVACAAQTDTDCVLSPEIGLGIPAAFIYDPTSESQMRMIIAPRIVFDAGEQDERAVRVLSPSNPSATKIFNFNFSISAEFLAGGSRTPVTETFSESAAFCIQLLRLVFTSECWAQLD
jgi:hypothetical protein